MIIHINCRLNGLEKYSPAIILIDKNLKLKKIHLLKNAIQKKYIFFLIIHNKKKLNI